MQHSTLTFLMVPRLSSLSSSLTTMDGFSLQVNQGNAKVLGSGLGYLEHICQLIEKIGQLQEHNLRLQKQVCNLQKEQKTNQLKEVPKKKWLWPNFPCACIRMLPSSLQSGPPVPLPAFCSILVLSGYFTVIES